jgi:uncharacterized protein YneF (UPF0154 family)
MTYPGTAIRTSVAAFAVTGFIIQRQFGIKNQLAKQPPVETE